MGMINVAVCVGNACQLKGSIQITESLKLMVQEHHLEDQVEITEDAFCMGHCRRGVSAKIDGECIFNISMANASEFFQENILSRFE